MAERPKISQISGDHSVQAVVAEVTATNADEVVIWINDTGASVNITGASYTPDASVTGNDTNNFALEVQNKGTDGTGTDGVTDVKTYASAVDIAVFDKDDLTVSTTAADILVNNGEVLTLKKTENGSGLTMPQGIATLTYQFA